MRCLLLILTLLLLACGDDSTGGAAAGCPTLGDPQVQCRFVGQLPSAAGGEPTEVTIGGGESIGSLEMTIASRRSGRQFILLADQGASSTGFAGVVEIVLEDLFSFGTLEAELVADGHELHLAIESDDLIGDVSFTGRYVGR